MKIYPILLVMLSASSFAAEEMPAPPSRADQARVAFFELDSCMHEFIPAFDDGISDASTIGKAVGDSCLEKGYKFLELSNPANVSQATISDIVRREGRPAVHSMATAAVLKTRTAKKKRK